MSLTEESRPSLSRGVRLQTDRKTGEPMLLFPEGVLYLSESACDIVRQCDGARSVREILLSLAEEYEAEPDTLREDVQGCLLDLLGRKLLVI